MKLNVDCIRDVMLYLEEELGVDLENGKFKSLTLHQIENEFDSEYSKEDIWYTIYNLKEIKYIDGTFKNSSSSIMYICNITNITWSGHQFLNSVRPKSIWEATKTGAKNLGTTSIAALSMIASEITKTIVTKPEVIDNIISLIKWDK